MIAKYRYTGTGNTGTFSWLLQRISAIVLFFALTFHFFGMITGAYNGMPRFILGCILLFGVFHAVNGLKSITDDYVSSLWFRSLLILLYWFIGIVILVQGISLLP